MRQENRSVECDAYKSQNWPFYLEVNYKRSHPGMNTYPMVVTNKEVELRKSCKYRDEKNMNRNFYSCLFDLNQKENVWNNK